MTAADLDEVVIAEVALHPFPWTRGNFSDSFAAGHGVFVALEDDAMVAYAVTSQVLDEAHLLNISVIADKQGTGRGGRVMRHLLAAAKEQGGVRMFLEVRASNQLAYRLYQRSGFIEIGRRKAYYPAHQGREDAIVMARDL
jgi:ribosomal-protein-alanine N-acetyltransferase